MYILTVVDYSDRSFEQDVYNKLNHLVEDFCDRIGRDFTLDKDYEEVRALILDKVNRKFVFDEQEWLITEI